MSWFSLSKKKPQVKDDGSRVNLNHMYISKGLVRIHIGKDIISKMDWKIGDRFGLLVGQDEQFGFLRIEPSSNGWTLACSSRSNKANGTSGTMKIHRNVLVGHLSQMPKTLPRTPIDLVIVGQGVEFPFPWYIEAREEWQDTASHPVAESAADQAKAAPKKAKAATTKKIPVGPDILPLSFPRENILPSEEKLSEPNLVGKPFAENEVSTKDYGKIPLPPATFVVRDR